MGSAPANDRKQGFEEIIAAHPQLPDRALAVGRLHAREGQGSDGGDTEGGAARSTCSTRTTTTWRSARSRPSRKPGSSPARTSCIVSIDAVRGAFEAMIAGKLNATVECNPLVGPAAHDVRHRGRGRPAHLRSASSWTKACSRWRRRNSTSRPASTDHFLFRHDRTMDQNRRNTFALALLPLAAVLPRSRQRTDAAPLRQAARTATPSRPSRWEPKTACRRKSSRWAAHCAA